MAALETALSLWLVCSVSSSSSSSAKIIFFHKPLFQSLKLYASSSVSILSHSCLSSSLPILYCPTTKHCFEICSAVQEVEVDENPQLTQVSNPKRKICVVNFSWSFTVADIKSLFGHYGTVLDVEIIKQKDGKNSNFAFVTMDSAEDAQTAIDELNLQVSCFCGQKRKRT